VLLGLGAGALCVGAGGPGRGAIDGLGDAHGAPEHDARDETNGGDDRDGDRPSVHAEVLQCKCHRTGRA
jgi:hypothetical protein